MTIEEIKIRQMANQHLLKPTDKMTVLHDLCGVQAQFMVNAMHSLKIRCSDYNEDTVKDGLVKNWTVRGTVHVFAEDDLPLFIHCNNGQDYLRNDWRGYTFWNQRDKWALTPERQAYFANVILEALKCSELTREELKDVCRQNGMTEPEESSMFDQWGGGVREMCERGFINYVVQEKKCYVCFFFAILIYCKSLCFIFIFQQEEKVINAAITTIIVHVVNDIAISTHLLIGFFTIPFFHYVNMEIPTEFFIVKIFAFFAPSN